MLYCCNRNSLSRDVADATSLAPHIMLQMQHFDPFPDRSLCSAESIVLLLQMQHSLFRKLLQVPRLKRLHTVAFATVKFNMLHTQHIGLRRIVAVATTEVFRKSVANATVRLFPQCCKCNTAFQINRCTFLFGIMSRRRFIAPLVVLLKLIDPNNV